MDKVVRLYSDGESLDDICFEMNYENVQEVIDELKLFIEWSKILLGNGKRFLFKDDIKTMVAERFLNGNSIYSISKDLSLPSSTVSNFIKSKGISTKRRFKYKNINWNDFDKCPTCKSEKGVRRLGLHNIDLNIENVHHSFCIKCNTEWYKEDSKVRKVNWEMIK